MPRYFLHIRDGDTLVEDPEGDELPDLDTAQAEAAAAAREILAERIKTGQLVGGSQFEIADQSGEVLATVPVADVFRLS